MVDWRDPDSIFDEIRDIMSDPNYTPITGPVSLGKALEQAKLIRVNRGTRPFEPIPLESRATDPRGMARAFAEVDRSNLQRDLQDALDTLPEMEQETVYLDLRDLAKETQDQELENALAKIGADVPRKFPKRRSVGRETIRRSGQFSRANILPNFAPPKKKKRKVSKYQKEFGKQLKKLKAKHPRTKITRLMKRAHTATRKAMK